MGCSIYGNLIQWFSAFVSNSTAFYSFRPIIGQQILKRACSLRSELKTFLCYLSDEKVDELANDIYVFVGECVTNVEEPERVGELSRAFGEMHAQLCNLGFRPEFFSVMPFLS